MSTKRVSYTKLLKEALSTEWDTTKTIDNKGPMLDPILGYDGGGELETNKDAASVLERYYFKEEVQDSLIEAVDNELDEDPQKKQVTATKKDIEKEVDGGESGSATFKEAEEKEPAEEEEPVEEGEQVAESDEIVSETEATENAVIEKLISEMEDENEEEEEEAVEESAEVATEQPPPPSADDKKEKLDVDEEMEEDPKEEEIKEGEEVTEQGPQSGAGHSAPPAMKSKAGIGDGIQKDEVTEAFEIFKEQIEDEPDDKDAEDIKSDDVQV